MTLRLWHALILISSSIPHLDPKNFFSILRWGPKTFFTI